MAPLMWNKSPYTGGNPVENREMNKLIKRAEHALESSNWNKALSFASKMHKKDASYVKTYKIKGTALEQMGKYLDACEAFEEGLCLHPRDAELMEFNGCCGKEIVFPEIVKILKKDERTKKYLEDPMLLLKSYEFVLGRMNLEIDPVQTEEDFTQWREIKEVMLGCKIENINPRLNVPKQFVRLYQNKQNACHQRAFGNAFFAAKRYKYAIKKYEDAINHLDGPTITLLNNIAICYFKLGEKDRNNFEICRTKSLKALDIGQQHGGDPKDISKAMARIGMCYESEKDIEKAIEWFEKSVDECPDELISTRILKLQKTLDTQSVSQRNPCMG